MTSHNQYFSHQFDNEEEGIVAANVALDELDSLSRLYDPHDAIYRRLHSQHDCLVDMLQEINLKRLMDQSRAGPGYEKRKGGDLNYIEDIKFIVRTAQKIHFGYMPQVSGKVPPVPSKAVTQREFLEPTVRTTNETLCRSDMNMSQTMDEYKITGTKAKRRTNHLLEPSKVGQPRVRLSLPTATQGRDGVAYKNKSYKDYEYKLRELQQSSSLLMSKLAKQIEQECLICRDPISSFQGYIAPPCGHKYCKDCTTNLVKAYIKDESMHPLRCCRIPIPLSGVERVIDRDLVLPFLSKEKEYNMPRDERLYCPQPGCSNGLIPSDAPTRKSIYILGRRVTKQCTICKSWICKKCGQVAHSCFRGCEDKETSKLRALAKEKGWKTCGRCGRIVEKVSGCQHMTCRCGYEFCYACGKRYTGKCKHIQNQIVIPE